MTLLDRILKRVGLVRYQRVVDAVHWADARQREDAVVTAWAVMSYLDDRGPA